LEKDKTCVIIKGQKAGYIYMMEEVFGKDTFDCPGKSPQLQKPHPKYPFIFVSLFPKSNP
jgi:hypothetical protein